MDEFMLAGDELCDTDDLAGPARTVKRSRRNPGAKVVLGPPRAAGSPVRRWKTVPIASPHGTNIPVRRGNPMKGPISKPVSDGYTYSLARPLGAKLTNLGDWSLGRRIPGPVTRGAFVKKPTLVPFAAGNMIPGFGSMLPGLSGDGSGMLPGLGDWPLGKNVRGPRTTRLVVQRSKQLSPSRGNMLPGLANDGELDVMDVGYLSADDLYDQVDGMGDDGMLPGFGLFDEMNKPALMIAGAALIAFWLMSKRRYA